MIVVVMAVGVAEQEDPDAAGVGISGPGDVLRGADSPFFAAVGRCDSDRRGIDGRGGDHENAVAFVFNGHAVAGKQGYFHLIGVQWHLIRRNVPVVGSGYGGDVHRDRVDGRHFRPAQELQHHKSVAAVKGPGDGLSGSGLPGFAAVGRSQDKVRDRRWGRVAGDREISVADIKRGHHPGRHFGKDADAVMRSRQNVVRNGPGKSAIGNGNVFGDHDAVVPHQLQIDISGHVFRGPGNVLDGADSPFLAAVGSGQSQGSGRGRRCRVASDGEFSVADIADIDAAVGIHLRENADAVMRARLNIVRNGPGISSIGD